MSEATLAPAAGPLRVLRHRDFRLLWLGLLVSAVGTWMQIVAQALLVLQLSHGSALALGEVSLAQALAFFAFSFFGGAVADHVAKRRLLLVTQTICMGFAATLGVLTVLHVVHVWMVVVLAFLQGVALSFDQPTRAALVPELVPKDELLNAISLQSTVFTSASAVGPALAGMALPLVGLAGIFFLNAASFLFILGALLAIRSSGGSGGLRTPTAKAISQALAAVRADGALPAFLFVYAALLFFGPSPALLLPVLAVDVLHVDSLRLGVLFSAVGIGTMCGGFGLASAGNPRRKGVLLVASAVLWSFALAGLAASRSFFPAFSSLLLVGIFQVGVSATAITLLQTRVPPEMRGRVMSINTLLIMGFRPLGDFLAAAVMARFGAPFAAAAGAAIVGAAALAVSMRASVRTA